MVSISESVVSIQVHHIERLRNRIAISRQVHILGLSSESTTTRKSAGVEVLDAKEGDKQRNSDQELSEFL
jgi:hypothetical protein